ncbi:hypothetical protein Tsubulata_022480 [Turnera subulata]|uniref:Uncharacterized protein n=1 Tax=Turnera subulata TaxID=218843 RepID=A0A9Q0FJM9_9ROSI|nr:hypothetical protein Tsubulata_022480 [Turnera subulata]
MLNRFPKLLRFLESERGRRAGGCVITVCTGLFYFFYLEPFVLAGFRRRMHRLSGEVPAEHLEEDRQAKERREALRRLLDQRYGINSSLSDENILAY